MRLRLITMATLLLPIACDERPAQPTVSERAGPIGLAEPAPVEEVAPAPAPEPEPEPEPE
ncbi:MAG: hypothetical protein IAG13_13155, partial [Deltaproteobacteria bacterium]|nr:hypothetical protein [Nannocystaceae bacterium]